MEVLAFYALIFCAIWLALLMAPWVLKRFSLGAGKVAAVGALFALAALWIFAWSAGFRIGTNFNGADFANLFWAVLISLSIVLSSGLYLLRRR